jgi:hypothetical protein
MQTRPDDGTARRPYADRDLGAARRLCYGVTSVFPVSLALHAALAAVSVSGDALCPSPREVEPALRALLEPGGDEHRLELRGAAEESDGLALTLRSGDGAVLAERELASEAPCEDRAQAVAAIVASWEFNLREQQRVPVQSRQAPPPVEPPPPAIPVELSAAAFVSADLGAGAASLSVGARPGPWLFSLGFFGSALRRVALQPGVVEVSRAAAELGAGRVLRLDRATLALQAHVLGGALALRGQGFGEDVSALRAELGFGAGVRLSLGSGPLRPWLGLRAVLWPLPRTLVVGGSSASTSLPLVEVFAGAGFTFDLARG